METITKSTNRRKRSGRTSDIMQALCQKKSINEDLQNLGFKLLNIKNSFLKTGLNKTLNKDKIDDDSYRCFIGIYDFINEYKLHDLEKLADNYKELRIESESKLVHVNAIKREQIQFLKETCEYLLGDLKNLKNKIKNESLVFVRKNAFRKPESSSINQNHVKEMNLFLNELPSRLNSIGIFLDKIYALGSDITKNKLDEYKKIEIYL